MAKQRVDVIFFIVLKLPIQTSLFL